MYKYFYAFNIRIPTYGLIVLCGIVFCNFLAIKVAKRDAKEVKELLMIEVAGGCGAILGAKLLTMLKVFMRDGLEFITWVQFKELGNSYYGGLVGFLIFGFVVCRIFGINEEKYIRKYIYILPILHAIWKVACFMGGCCIGIPYEGLFAVVFPNGVNSLSGTNVFPVQLLETMVSLLLAFFLWILKTMRANVSILGIYLGLYGLIRFFTEFLRYHDSKSIMTDGQICSIIAFAVGIVSIYGFYLNGRLADE